MVHLDYTNEAKVIVDIALVSQPWTLCVRHDLKPSRAVRKYEEYHFDIPFHPSLTAIWTWGETRPVGGRLPNQDTNKVFDLFAPKSSFSPSSRTPTYFLSFIHNTHLNHGQLVKTKTRALCGARSDEQGHRKHRRQAPQSHRPITPTANLQQRQR